MPQHPHQCSSIPLQALQHFPPGAPASPKYSSIPPNTLAPRQTLQYPPNTPASPKPQSSGAAIPAPTHCPAHMGPSSPGWARLLPLHSGVVATQVEQDGLILVSAGNQPRGRMPLVVPSPQPPSRCGAGGGVLAGGDRPSAAAASWLWPGPRRGGRREHLVAGKRDRPGKCAELLEEALAVEAGVERTLAPLLHRSCAEARRERRQPVSAQVGAHSAPPLQGGETEARQSQMMQFGVAQDASAGLAPPPPRFPGGWSSIGVSLHHDL